MKELDVVRMKNGKIGTILEYDREKILIEFEKNKGYETQMVDRSDVETVVWEA